jgi:hypothetical protein
MLKRPIKRRPAQASRSSKKPKPVFGWREWAVLPDLPISKIKVKIDTGARTSSLHAFDVVVFRRQGKDFVRFKVHPLQRNTRRVVDCEARLSEWRQVTDSGGKRTVRPVIETRIMMGAREVLAEVTLISRDAMGFRMLIGRQSLKGVVIDPSRSYIAADDVYFARTPTTSRRMDEEE